MLRKAGMMLSEIPFSNMPVLLKSAGFDFFIIDCEHGGFDYCDISRIIMSAKLCGITSIVRLADNSRKDIIKLLDMGADGLLLQMTNTAADIRQVVEYAKYSPEGKRGISTMRAHSLYNPPELLQYMKSANSHTKVYAQIETLKGMENAEEIISTDGVDGFFLGPNDLSCEYDCLGDNNAEQILQAVDYLCTISKKLNKESGIITGNPHYLTRSKQAEMNQFCVGSELSMLKSASIQAVEMIKK